MTMLNRNLLLIFSFITIFSACSNQVTIKSSTPDKVVISAPAEKFVEAYDVAKKECEKNTKIAQYIPDETKDLREVSFNCFGEDPEEVATAENAEEDTIPEEEPVLEETNTDAATETDVESEEATSE